MEELRRQSHSRAESKMPDSGTLQEVRETDIFVSDPKEVKSSCVSFNWSSLHIIIYHCDIPDHCLRPSVREVYMS